MGAFGSIDIPARGIDYFRATLQDREAALVNAKRRRDVILNDIGAANVRVDGGEQRARFELGGLNKANVEAGRLILSIERAVGEARKRVTMAEEQAAAAALKRAQVDGAAVFGDRLFEVETPDGRRVRHRYASPDGLQKILQTGYRVVAEVFGTGIDGKRGLVEPLGQSTMKTLLTVHGDELLAFLKEHGIVGSLAQAPELAACNKESAQ